MPNLKLELKRKKKKLRKLFGISHFCGSCKWIHGHVPDLKSLHVQNRKMQLNNELIQKKKRNSKHWLRGNLNWLFQKIIDQNYKYGSFSKLRFWSSCWVFDPSHSAAKSLFCGKNSKLDNNNFFRHKNIILF